MEGLWWRLGEVFMIEDEKFCSYRVLFLCAFI